ncbi:hypothetical protein AND_004522 [Anopheles darlingi]|uniref:Maestro heat-like repeat-containing protein family member 1 n=1 Tax=Anopheles darlingi TaxID=43151 RepID=W5JHA7_ANODA|nr:hypothetical protein AND_004522 [Anopheles darlingi]
MKPDRMEKQEEETEIAHFKIRPFRSGVIKQDHNLSAIVFSLLDSLNDKDEVLRITTEAALTRIAARRHDEIVEVFCEHRKKHPKLSESQTIVILRVLSYIATNLIGSIDHQTAFKCIQYSITEITKCNEQSSVQNPCREILVSVGRQYSKEIMEVFLKHLSEEQVANCMLMDAIGALATSNMNIVPYIKSILGHIMSALTMIKQDVQRQSHAYAIGRFCEAFLEYQEQQRQNPNEEIPMMTGARYEIHDEVSCIYDHLQAQWLSSREPKVINEVLSAFALMYPLLPVEKISDNLNKTLTSVLALYRKSYDRSAITQYLAAIIKTVLHLNSKLLAGMCDNLIGCLFDLVCVNPDYDKPQTVKGHFEVLRCFDLLAPEYGEKTTEILLLHLRNNNERERIKSLLVLTHLTNTSEEVVRAKLPEIVVILKGMLATEKPIKVKMVLLKTVIAFMQKKFVQDKEFVTFLIRSSCTQSKRNLDCGTLEEHLEFQRACNDTINILSSTVGTVDQVLKMELLSCYLRYEFTDICSTTAKCLANLLTKDPDMTVVPDQQLDPSEENQSADYTALPSPTSVFVRTLALLGSFNDLARLQNLLSFLKSYAGCLYHQLKPLWNEQIAAIQSELNGGCDEARYFELLHDLVRATIKDIDDHSFVEDTISEMFYQLPLYQPITSTQVYEFQVPPLDQEKRMLVKMMGIFLCHSINDHLIVNKIDLIVGLAKAEKIDKNLRSEEYEYLMRDYAESLGYLSAHHLDKVMAKLMTVIDDSSVKKSSSFFSNLNFIKDSAKEVEVYKMKILSLQALNLIVFRAPKEKITTHFTDSVVCYLVAQCENKQLFVKQLILDTLLALLDIFLAADGEEQMIVLKIKQDLHKICMTITSDSSNEYLPLFPSIIKLSTILVKLNAEEHELDVNGLLDSICFYFFSTAQKLKSRLDPNDDDARNVFLARNLNLCLPEVNRFIQQMLQQQNASPACLDDVHSILEGWLKNKNTEARICACHVYNSTLAVYMKSMKIGCEGPSKFNQTGSMLGKIIPRCIDSNATVRQTGVEVLTKILEIAHVYETVTVADDRVDWMQELNRIHSEIVTDDPKEIYRIAGELARIVAQCLSSYQYVKFSKCLLGSVADPEQSSVIGASHVLKLFMHVKGADMFHAIPELVKECLYAVKICDVPRARTTILKSILALTKHHPKLVCNEVLGQCLPLEEHVIEFWKTLTMDTNLTGIILDNFINIVTTTCLYEQTLQNGRGDEKRCVTLQPFAIIVVLGEVFKCEGIRDELQVRFPEIFCMLLSTLASYISLQPPHSVVAQQSSTPNATLQKGSRRTKDALKTMQLNPCQVVLEAFHTFLDTLGMQQISVVLTICPDMATSSDLNNFIEILAPLGVATANEVGINSALMKQLVTTMSKYVCSPYDTQRIASTGFYAHLVPLQPSGETASVVMLNLNSSLNDPNPLVRGLSIRGMAYLGSLTKHNIEKYSEVCLSALLKGIDDYNQNCFINIPLDSIRGLSKVLQVIDPEKFEMFQVSLAIRIRPFFENNSTELRESAILLFGDMCGQKIKQISASTDVNAESMASSLSESLMEQLKANLCCLLLHLSEQESMIARACKLTLKNVCNLLSTSKMRTIAQMHLIEHGQLQYSTFLKDFAKLIGEELHDWISDFIDACLPLLRSQWPEVRGNAAILIGLLHCHNPNVKSKPMESIGNKIAALLKDECKDVKVSAAEALGYIYGGL